MKDKPKHIIISTQPATAFVSVDNPMVWFSDNFAQDWYIDAINQSRNGKDHNAIRREIIFATCFAESYIFEWTRQKVQIEEINDYFPSRHRFKNDPRYHRTLIKKWKEIPEELYKESKIPLNPKLDLSGLGTLVKYRNGLIHASASRPATDIQPAKIRPYPTKNMLRKLKAGWAVKTVFDLVTSLHKAVGDPLPHYVEYP